MPFVLCVVTQCLGVQMVQVYWVITSLKTSFLIVWMSVIESMPKNAQNPGKSPTILAWWKRLYFSCHVCCQGRQTSSGTRISLFTAAGASYCSRNPLSPRTTSTPAGGTSKWSLSLMVWCSETTPEPSTKKNKWSDICPSDSLLCLETSAFLSTAWHQKIWSSWN